METPSQSRLTSVPRWIGVGLCCVLGWLETGCTEKVQSEPLGVVSSDPEQDGAALRAANNHLSEVKYSVIQRSGPRPIWDRMGNKAEAENAGGSSDRPATRRDKRECRDPRDARTREVIYLSATQPSTQPVVTRTSYIEEDLPLEVVELPDGRVRLIWQLQSYGGSTVTSSRDPNTARRTVAVAAPDLAPLATVLQQQLGANGIVTPLPRENTIVVTCDRAMKTAALEMLYKLDIPARQVEISAKIFEVARDFDFQQGAQVLARRLDGDNAQSAQSIFQTPKFIEQMIDPSGIPFQGSIITFMKVFQEAGISVDASIQLLAEAGMIKVVSSPRMTVAAGQTGYMLAGQELPVQQSAIVNGALQISTQYKPVGVQLYITPQSIGPERVKLHTISIVSHVSGFSPLPKITGNNPEKTLVNPIIESREAETAVTIQDGDTLVISGLRMSRTVTRENKVPGLGDIPLLGWMFKNHRSQQQLTDLYFFVTPELL